MGAQALSSRTLTKWQKRFNWPRKSNLARAKRPRATGSPRNVWRRNTWRATSALHVVRPGPPKRGLSVPLELQELSSQDELAAIEEEWRDLWRADTSATPFQSPDWLIPWTRWLWGGGRLRVMAVRDGARLTALAPLFQWGYGTRPEVVRMSFLGAGISDYLGFIAIPEAATVAARLVFRRIAATKSEWSICDLQEIHPDSALLRSEIPERLSASNSPCGVCPVLTPPRHADELLAERKPHFRRNLRTAEKALRACGE